MSCLNVAVYFSTVLYSMFVKSILGRSVVRSAVRKFSATPAATTVKGVDIYNPTEEHAGLRQMLRSFVESDVDPQAKEFNAREEFNKPLYQKLGQLGLLGVTVPEEYGGSGMDAVAGEKMLQH